MEKTNTENKLLRFILAIFIIIVFSLLSLLFISMNSDDVDNGSKENVELASDVGDYKDTLKSDTKLYLESISTKKSTELRNEYEQKITEIRGFLDQIVLMNAEGIKNKDTYTKLTRYYTVSFFKAATIADIIISNDMDIYMNIDREYFNQHIEYSNVCNVNYLDKETWEVWNELYTINTPCT